jgi:hypothetical protein
MTLSTPLFLRDWMNDGLWKATHAGITLLMTLSHCSSMSGPSLVGFDVSIHGFFPTDRSSQIIKIDPSRARMM